MATSRTKRKLLAPQWKPLAGIGRSGTGRLLGALLTTYDPPDPSVLIEHYLPHWLGLENSYVSETDDRLRYFAELEAALRGIKDRIAIVSSGGDSPACAEGWIWNYIARFQVGATGAAAQHAKLWMFHYEATEARRTQTLEIVISSVNLTQPGLRSQIQSGWRCVVPLQSTGSNAREKGWGCLPNFLAELGRASGADSVRVAEWRELLRRAECPEDVEFVASVAGRHSPATLRTSDTAWGVSGLANLWSQKQSRELTVLTPTFGRWSREGFEQWCETAGVASHEVASAWIRCEHSWADHWQLDHASERALSAAGMQWREIAVPDSGRQSPLCDEHKQEDPRWSHAKLYELREGNRRRMLVTSANFSESAWGRWNQDGTLEIGNFELGVAFPVHDAFGGRLGQGEFVRHTCAVDYSRDAELQIGWLAADWGGKTLRIACRAQYPLAARVEVTIARAESTRRHRVAWSSGVPAQAALAWPEVEGAIPIAVTVTTTKGESRTIPVHDTRTSDDGRLLCPDYDEAKLREAADILLEEKYGYARVPDEGDGKGTGNGKRKGAAGGDYAVDAYVDARRRFRCVDNWWNSLRSADENLRKQIVRDGKQLYERWNKAGESAPNLGERVAARIAADELQLRIRQSK
ncbi:Tyrosyl-DNA phosphodiesterase [Burkholderia pseudomallei]|nr:Tyrosyl-DNA phosphodiesterase [Burkholderia pseudomallei]CAJ8046100.1 Tyrosyl-DNA phosphodiesterase [Burkholderia pseudomallei]